ncbi:MAG: hypothetical protein RIQ94_1219 [Pseudomonadota bacterium]
MKATIPVFRVFLFLMALFVFTDALALSVNPSSATINVGNKVNIAVTNASSSTSKPVRVSTSTNNTSVTYLKSSFSKGTATITGIAPGKSVVTVRDNKTSKKINVTIYATSIQNQTISFGSIPSLIYNGTATVTATATSGLTPVIFSSLTNTICSINGTTVTGLAGGICTIAANQAGNANYSAAPQVTKDIIVEKILQTIVLGPPLSLIDGATGTVSATSSSALMVSYSSITPNICTINGAVVKAISTGKCTIAVNQAGNNNYNAAPEVTQDITVTASPILTVLPATVSLSIGATTPIAVSNAVGAVTVTSSSNAIATATFANNIITVKGVSAGSATLTIKDTKSTLTVPVTVQAAPVAGNYTLLAWNDLGMHCMDGMDFSVFTILPPYNTLHAQLKNKSGKLITTNVKLTYEAVPDSTGSMNSSSYDKTNFWDNVGLLFGLNPAKDEGVNLDGLASGTPAPGSKVPSLIPTDMIYNTDFKWFEAEGIPMTPFPDNPLIDNNGNPVKNFYPTVKVVARDLSNNILAETTTVLPVSDEMTCKGCHASTTISNAAKPTAGWVVDLDKEKDWKRNILRLHDEKQLTTPLYQAALAASNFDPKGLLATADSLKPVLCVKCHASNAYFDKLNKKTVMSGFADIRPFTQVLHSKHANVIDPATNLPLDTSGDRQACYNCHPGSVTQCLRGPMSKAKDISGNNAVSCQSCHGNLTAVGSKARQGWFNEPVCESCHNNSKRTTTATDVNGLPKISTDHTFATNANTPVPGLNLYRFSTGHGGLQCEACHGATHAEYPSTHADDNTQSIAVQGHTGPVAECTACHKTVPTTVNGGPHGMHTRGNAWVSSHQGANKNGSATTPSCAYCHGTTSAGTPLSAIKVAKTINAGNFGTKNWPVGYQVSCFSCHNGPNP